MPLDKLIERIQDDARDEARRIKEDAERQADEILADADTEAGEIYTQTVDAARKAAGAEKKQRLAMAGLEARKVILGEKQRLIDQVFEKALDAMLELPEDRYLEVMTRLAVESCGDQDGELLLSATDRDRLGEKVVSRANDVLEKAGKKARLTLSGDVADIAGGFILRVGGVEVNNSLEALIESRREELESRLVEILFGE